MFQANSAGDVTPTQVADPTPMAAEKRLSKDAWNRNKVSSWDTSAPETASPYWLQDANDEVWPPASSSGAAPASSSGAWGASPPPAPAWGGSWGARPSTAWGGQTYPPRRAAAQDQGWSAAWGGSDKGRKRERSDDSAWHYGGPTRTWKGAGVN